MDSFSPTKSCSVALKVFNSSGVKRVFGSDSAFKNSEIDVVF